MPRHDVPVVVDGGGAPEPLAILRVRALVVGDVGGAVGEREDAARGAGFAEDRAQRLHHLAAGLWGCGAQWHVFIHQVDAHERTGSYRNLSGKSFALLLRIQ